MGGDGNAHANQGQRRSATIQTIGCGISVSILTKRAEPFSRWLRCDL
jgi:hypothetical protein